MKAEDLKRVLTNMKKVMEEKTPEQIHSDYEDYMNKIESELLKPSFKIMKIGDVPAKE